jgi:COMM domain containing 8
LHLSIDHLVQSPITTNVDHKSILKKFPFINTKEESLLILNFIANAYQQYCLNEINDDELRANFSNLNSEFQQISVNVIEARKNEVLTKIVDDQNAAKDLLLETFDWDIKWILGNSSLASQRQQFISLILNCKHSSDKLKTVNFEMTKDKLNDLISVLEKCNEQLSPEEPIVK